MMAKYNSTPPKKVKHSCNLLTRKQMRISCLSLIWMLSLGKTIFGGVLWRLRIVQNAD